MVIRSVEDRFSSGPCGRLRAMATVDRFDQRKRIAAHAAAQLVEDGMRLGLGTGSTVAHLLPAIAERGLRALRCVATSPATAEQARALGLPVEEFDSPDALDALDLAIDGADQVAPDWWVVKGGGGAHTREKIVAAAAERFVIVAGEEKLVDAIRPPVPVELLRFGLAATLRELGQAEVRAGWPPSPDGGVIADVTGHAGDPGALAARLDAVPGVVEHGLFPPSLITAVIVGSDDGPRRLAAPPGR
jgi:ribose 5-phosphate isomerase A